MQAQLAMRLAAFGKSDPHRGSGESWDKVTAALEKRSVRLMAGRFIDAMSLESDCPFQAILAAARSRMEVKVCAFVISTDLVNHPPTYEDDIAKMSASAVCVCWGPWATSPCWSTTVAGRWPSPTPLCLIGTMRASSAQTSMFRVAGPSYLALSRSRRRRNFLTPRRCSCTLAPPRAIGR